MPKAWAGGAAVVRRALAARPLDPTVARAADSFSESAAQFHSVRALNIGDPPPGLSPVRSSRPEPAGLRPFDASRLLAPH